jgi:hypothetical protein
MSHYRNTQFNSGRMYWIAWGFLIIGVLGLLFCLYRVSKTNLDGFLGLGLLSLALGCTLFLVFQHIAQHSTGHRFNHLNRYRKGRRKSQ